MAGMITSKKTLVTKNNKMMAFVDLEDLYGEVEVVVFPNVYERCREAVSADNVVVVRGKLNFKEEEMPKLLADSVVGIRDVEEKLNGVDSNKEMRPRSRSAERGGIEPVKVRIPQQGDEKEILEQLRLIFGRHRGNTPVLIYLQNGKIVKTADGGGVHPTVEMFDTVAEIVGRPNIKGRPVFR